MQNAHKVSKDLYVKWGAKHSISKNFHAKRVDGSQWGKKYIFPVIKANARVWFATKKGMIVHFNSIFVALSSMVEYCTVFRKYCFRMCFFVSLWELDFSVATKIMSMGRNGNFYTKKITVNSEANIGWKVLRSINIREYLQTKMQDWWLKLKLRLKFINPVVMGSQPFFSKKHTHFGIDNVLANSKLSMHCSARCCDQKICLDSETSANIFFFRVEADKHNGSEYSPRKRLFIFFWFSISRTLNVNRLFQLVQFACKVSILIGNGYQFERSKGVAFCFSLFIGFDATRLPSSQNACSFTFCRCLLGMVPWFFTLNESETNPGAKLFGNWISYVVQNPGQTTGSENLNHPHAKKIWTLYMCACACKH